MKNQNLLAIFAVISTSYMISACGKNPAFRVIPVGTSISVDQQKEQPQAKTDEASGTKAPAKTVDTPSDQVATLPKKDLPIAPSVSTPSLGTLDAPINKKPLSGDESKAPALKELPKMEANKDAAKIASKQDQKNSTQNSPTISLEDEIISTILLKSDKTPTLEDIEKMKPITDQNFSFSKDDLAKVDYEASGKYAAADKYIKIGTNVFAKPILAGHLYKLEIRKPKYSNVNPDSVAIPGMIYRQDVTAKASNFAAQNQDQGTNIEKLLGTSLEVVTIKILGRPDKVAVRARNTPMLSGEIVKNGITHFQTKGADFSFFHLPNLATYGVSEGSITNPVLTSLLKKQPITVSLTGIDSTSGSSGIIGDVILTPVSKPEQAKAQPAALNNMSNKDK